MKRSKMTLQELRRKRRAILRISARHGATNVRVFGSVARGEAGLTSDVDFLVDFPPEKSYFDLASLSVDLEKFLNRGIDLVTEDELHWYIRDRVLAEAVPL